MLDAPQVAGKRLGARSSSNPTGCGQFRPTGGCPKGRVLHTGCGTSFHAAQTGGWAEQALELVLRPREADALVVVSHEGDTQLSLEAARASTARSGW